MSKETKWKYLSFSSVFECHLLYGDCLLCMSIVQGSVPGHEEVGTEKMCSGNTDYQTICQQSGGQISVLQP